MNLNKILRAMNLKRYRKLNKNQKISYLFLFVIIGYSTTVSLHVVYEFSVINSTLGTLAIPNGFYLTNFSTPEPEFQISVGFSNLGFLDITDIEMNVSLILSYNYLPENLTVYDTFFSKHINYGSVTGSSKLNFTIKSEINDFNVSKLMLFWDNVINSSDIKFLMDVQFNCRFYFGLIPFTIHAKNIDLFLIGCPTCP